ncbi:MAG: hypothetical protein GEU73_13840 [Chloroflexi bacterium]|nr:hypothetical protein [Chloroflexota bacterium]
MQHYDDVEALALLRPLVHASAERLGAQRFSTKRLIDELRSTPDGQTAYRDALEAIERQGAPPHMALHVVHGQVIPELLRRSGLVRFAGYIHGEPEEDDGYGVPSWWRKQ